MFYPNFTAEQVRHLFRSRKGGKAYTRPEQVASVYLDLLNATLEQARPAEGGAYDDGDQHSLSNYARMMGVPRSRLRREWEEITRAVWMQATSHGRQWTWEARAYLDFVGLHYDASIPDRSRKALQSQEAYRPSQEEIDGILNSKNQIAARSDQKTGSGGSEKPPSEQVLDRSDQIAARHTKTSIPSTHPLKGEGDARPHDSVADAPETAASSENLFGETPEQDPPSQQPFSKTDANAVLAHYPKQIALKPARLYVLHALHEIRDGGEPDPVAWLTERVRLYAQSAEGKRWRYVPKPENWFRDGRYTEDPATWNRAGEPEPRGQPQKPSPYHDSKAAAAEALRQLGLTPTP